MVAGDAVGDRVGVESGAVVDDVQAQLTTVNTSVLMDVCSQLTAIVLGLFLQLASRRRRRR